mmetsp:Transcript_26178/g.62189  ORF Transcript_26178/g.62189 Transcript_26178/m.62189 type:complete len:230 (-) Transcript_26178:11-700(-)
MAAVDGKNPTGAVAVGNANIPAPTIVPATKLAAPATLPVRCVAVTMLLSLKSLSPSSLVVVVYCNELYNLGTSPASYSGKTIRSSSTRPIFSCSLERNSLFLLLLPLVLPCSVALGLTGKKNELLSSELELESSFSTSTDDDTDTDAGAVVPAISSSSTEAILRTLLDALLCHLLVPVCVLRILTTEGAAAAVVVLVVVIVEKDGDDDDDDGDGDGDIEMVNASTPLFL